MISDKLIRFQVTVLRLLLQTLHKGSTIYVNCSHLAIYQLACQPTTSNSCCQLVATALNTIALAANPSSCYLIIQDKKFSDVFTLLSVRLSE